jgi:hypothetical protein
MAFHKVASRDFLLGFCVPFSDDPLAYVRRTIQQSDALCLAGTQKAHHLCVNQLHLFQIQHDAWRAGRDLSSQLVKVLRSNSTNQLDSRAVFTKGLLNLQRHICSVVQRAGRSEVLK